MDATLPTLGRLIKQVQWLNHRAMDSRLRANGSTIMQWDALRAIDREPDATSRRLATETFQSEQSFGVMATGMEARGLIERTPGSGRAIHHRLTDHGRQVLQLGNGYARELLGATLGVLDHDERRQLGHLLERVRDAQLAGG